MVGQKSSRPLITLDEARSLFGYNPETGDLIWKVIRKCHGGFVVPGTVAGTNSNGYTAVGVNQRIYRAHRIAWLLQTGEWPSAGMDIDHINGNRSDNRWCNLRLATRSQNNMNRSKAKTAHGAAGVYQRTYRSGNKKWHARVAFDGQLILLGHFDTKEDALAAREAAEVKYFGAFRNAA